MKLMEYQAHADRTYKRCLCCVCGEIYNTDDHGEEFVCERCFHGYDAIYEFLKERK